MNNPPSWDQVVRTDAYQQLPTERQQGLADAYAERYYAPKYDAQTTAALRERMGSYVPDRTGSEIAGDIAGTAAKTALGVGEGVYRLADLATEIAGATVGAVTLGMVRPPSLEDLTRDKYGETFGDRFRRSREIIDDGLASDATKLQMQRLGRIGQDAEGFREHAKGYIESIEYLAQNPALLAQLGVESAGQFLLSGGVGRKVGDVAAKRFLQRAKDTGIGDEAAQRMARQQALRAGAAATMITEAGVEGGYAGGDAAEAVMRLDDKTLDASPEFNRLMGQPDMTRAQAKAILARRAKNYASGVGAAISLAANKFTGAGLRQTELFSKMPTLSTGGVVGKVLGTAGTAVREAAQESVQEGGAQFGQNVGVRASGADPSQRLDEGVGAAAGTGAILGSLQGGGLDAARRLLVGDDPRAARRKATKQKLAKDYPDLSDATLEKLLDAMEQQQPEQGADGQVTVGGGKPSTIIQPQSAEDAVSTTDLGGDLSAQDQQSEAALFDGADPDAAPPASGEMSGNLESVPTTKAADKAEPVAPDAQPNAQQGERDRKDLERRTQASTRQKKRLQYNPDRDDLILGLRKMGGIDTALENDLQGRLKHLDQDNRAPGLFSIEQSGRGMTLDDAVEWAFENGYIQKADKAELIERLHDAEGGAKHYTAGSSRWEELAEAEAKDREDAEAEREALRDELGVDPFDMGDALREFEAEDIDPALAALSARAVAADPNAFERAAVEFENDDAGFERAIRSIVDGREKDDTDTEAGGSRAANQRDGTPAPETDAGERGEAAGGVSDNDEQEGFRLEAQQPPRQREARAGGSTPDMFGRDEAAQQAADARRAKDAQRNGREDVDPGIDGGLFSSQSKQVDIESAPGNWESESTPGDRQAVSVQGKTGSVSDGSDTGTNSADQIDSAANEAATSPTNDTPEPTQAQKEAGNYKMGHMRVLGLDVSIENPKGSVRKGTDRDGSEWSQTLKDHYGYIRGTTGKDKDHLDVFVGPDPDGERFVYVVDQVDPETGQFDEHKIMLGYPNQMAARQAYTRNYADGWKGLGAMTRMPVDEFKAWLAGDTTEPVSAKLAQSGRDTASKTGSGEALRRRVEAAENTLEPVRTEVDWGTNSGQGKRIGKAVVGAMSDAPRGKRTYTNVLGALPKNEQDEVQAYGRPDLTTLYAKARSAGYDHEQAMVVLYAREGDVTWDEAARWIQAAQEPTPSAPEGYGDSASYALKTAVASTSFTIDPDAYQVDDSGKAQARALERLNTALEREHKRPVAVYPVRLGDSELAEEARRLKRAYADIFGRRVIYFASDDKLAPEGAYIDGDTLFVNIQAGRDGERSPLQFVAAHEFLHSLEANDPALFGAFKRGALAMARNQPEYAQVLRETYARDDLDLDGDTIEREFLADGFAAFMGDPRAMEALQAEMQPSAMLRFFGRLLTFLRSLADRLRGEGLRTQHGERYFTNVEAMRELVAQTARAAAARHAIVRRLPPKDTAIANAVAGVREAEQYELLYDAQQTPQVPDSPRTVDDEAAPETSDRTGPGRVQGAKFRAELRATGKRTLAAKRIDSLADAAAATLYIQDQAVERLEAVVTDADGKPLAVVGTFKGAIDAASVYPRVLMQEVMGIDGAANLWLTHNHPSGTPSLSRSDINIADTVAETFFGTRVRVRGITAVSGGQAGKTAEFEGYEPDGGRLAGKATRGQGPEVPVYERVIAHSGTSDVILRDPKQSARYLEQAYGDTAGVLLLDSRHRPIGMLPWAPDKADQLLDTGNLDDLYEAVASANPVAAIIHNPGQAYTQRQYLSLGGALARGLELHVLDVVDTAAGADMPSAAARGLHTTGPVFSKDAGSAPVFYSQLERVIERKMAKAEPAKGLALKLRGWQNKGDFKAEELDWSGLIGWLDEQSGRVSKAEVLAYLDANRVRVSEVLLAGEDTSDQKSVSGSESEGFVQYPGQTMDGGDNYRELLLTLPKRQARRRTALPVDTSGWRVTRLLPPKPDGSRTIRVDSGSGMRVTTLYGFEGTDAEAVEQARREQESENQAKEQARQDQESAALNFADGHYREYENVVAHVRFKERVVDGKRTLAIEEIQSDWHQAGRRDGYGKPIWGVFNERGILDMTAPSKAQAMQLASDNGWPASAVRESGQTQGVPDAPFKASKDWSMLALRRMIRWAADNGFEQIAWTSGAIQADRYDLSKQIQAVLWALTADDRVDIAMKPWEMGGEFEPAGSFAVSKLPEVVGKELADKIAADLNAGEVNGEFEGVDLQVGGEGMKGFYDNILPRAVNKYVKKFGARVGRGKVNGEAVHTLPVTDQMRETALQGQPLFSRRTGGPFDAFHAMGRQSLSPQAAVDEARRVIGLPVSLPVRRQALGQNTPAMYDSRAGEIVFNSALEVPGTDMVMAAVEELFHAVDSIDVGRSSAAGSPRLRPGGDLWNEVQDAPADLRAWFKYPLDYPPGLSQAERAAELFARLAVVYYGNREYMRRAMPLSFGVYDDGNRAIRGERVRGDVRQHSDADLPTGGQRGQDRATGSGNASGAGQRNEDPRLADIRDAFRRSLRADRIGRKVLQRLKTAPPSGGVSGSGVQFSRRPARIDDAKMREAMRRVGTLDNELPVVERLGRGASTVWEDAKQTRDSLAQGLFDRFRPILDAEGNIDAERSGYIAARLSTGASSVMYGAMIYGTPEFRGGMIRKKDGSKGLTKILEPVADDINAWTSWMAAKRAEYLASEEGGYRENNLNLEQIELLKTLANGREEAFEAVAKEFRAFNTAMLELARDTGLLSDEQVKAFSREAYYIPFYRQDEDGDVTAPWTARGLSHQSAKIKALKGGVQPLNDPLENVFANMSRLIDASLKNYALYRTLMSNPQIATRVSLKRDTGKGNKIVQVMHKGKPFKFEVDDPPMLRALTSIGERPMQGYGIAFGRWTKRLLTTGVTAEPTFMLRNFIRDMMHAWIIDKHGFKFAWDSAKGARDTLKTISRQAQADPGKADPVVVSMMFAGASFLGGYVYGTDPAKNAAALRRSLRRKGLGKNGVDKYMGSLASTPAEFWARYRDLGDAFENANRAAVAKAALAAGKSELEAMFEAKDLMDYSLRGNWAFIQVLADVLPFFNARLQGLYKLGREMNRGGKRAQNARRKLMLNIANQLVAKGMLIALASLMLAKVNEDEDRYQELQDWDKDANWHLFGPGGVHVRIPKPFELGILFGTVPERMFQLGAGNDEAQDSLDAFVRAVTGTLAINPVPQAVRPGMELYMNWDMFMDRPIEGMADQGKLPEDRFGGYTSPTMVALGQRLGMSPKKLEHLWNGYLGTLGSYALAIPDTLIRAAEPGEMPDRTIQDYPVIGSFVRAKTARSTQYATDLYEMSKLAEQLNRSLNERTEAGRDTESLLEDPDNLRLLYGRRMMNQAKRASRSIRNEMDAVRKDQNMTGAQKRRELDLLQQELNALQKETVQAVDAIEVQ